MTYDIASIDQLVDALGGPSAVGEWLGITQEAVSNWKARQTIPPGWHLRLSMALIKKGLSVSPAVFDIPESEVPPGFFAGWAAPMKTARIA